MCRAGRSSCLPQKLPSSARDAAFGLRGATGEPERAGLTFPVWRGEFRAIPVVLIMLKWTVIILVPVLCGGCASPQFYVLPDNPPAAKAPESAPAPEPAPAPTPEPAPEFTPAPTPTVAQAQIPEPAPVFAPPIAPAVVPAAAPVVAPTNSPATAPATRPRARQHRYARGVVVSVNPTNTIAKPAAKPVAKQQEKPTPKTPAP